VFLWRAFSADRKNLPVLSFPFGSFHQASVFFLLFQFCLFPSLVPFPRSRPFPSPPLGSHSSPLKSQELSSLASIRATASPMVSQISPRPPLVSAFLPTTPSSSLVVVKVLVDLALFRQIRGFSSFSNLLCRGSSHFRTDYSAVVLGCSLPGRCPTLVPAVSFLQSEYSLLSPLNLSTASFY